MSNPASYVPVDFDPVERERKFGDVTLQVDRHNHAALIKNQNKLIAVVEKFGETEANMTVVPTATMEASDPVNSVKDALAFTLKEMGIQKMNIKVSERSQPLNDIIHMATDKLTCAI